MLTRAIGVFVAIGLFASASSATAELMKVSVPQRGQWDTAVTELGTRGGIFKKYGLDIEVLYTQSGPESHQTLSREKTPAKKIARALKRTEGATRQKAFSLGVSLDSRA